MANKKSPIKEKEISKLLFNTISLLPIIQDYMLSDISSLNSDFYAKPGKQLLSPAQFFILMIAISMIILVVLSTVCFQKFGLFRQIRIGKNGKDFWIYKIRSLEVDDESDSIIIDNDPRVNSFGRIMRKTKLDEIPQLWNVLIGDMSLVGPRPDVPGYADTLTGEDRIILSVRPGITGPATLKYINEEEILAAQDDPKKYNDDVIWKDKVEINKEYVMNWSFKNDVRILIDTFFS